MRNYWAESNKKIGEEEHAIREIVRYYILTEATGLLVRLLKDLDSLASGTQTLLGFLVFSETPSISSSRVSNLSAFPR